MDSREKKKEKRFSTIRIVGGYLLFGALWIIFSDNILKQITEDFESYLNLQTYKGLFFILATAVLLLGLVRNEFRVRDAVEKKLEVSLKRQAELTRELHHRVKNNLQLVQSLLNLQRDAVRESGKDVEVNELLRRVAIRVQIPALFHQKVYDIDKNSMVPLDQYLNEIVDRYRSEYERELSNVRFEVDFDRMHIQAVKAVPIGFVISELLLNVVMHAFEGMTENALVKVSGKSRDGVLSITVEDNGGGYAREHSSEGLGSTIIEAMLGQINGELDYSEGPGTRAVITVPEHLNREKKD